MAPLPPGKDARAAFGRKADAQLHGRVDVRFRTPFEGALPDVAVRMGAVVDDALF